MALRGIQWMGEVVHNRATMGNEYAIPNENGFGGPNARLFTYVTVTTNRDFAAVTKKEQLSANVRMGTDLDITDRTPLKLQARRWMQYSCWINAAEIRHIQSTLALFVPRVRKPIA